MKNIHIISHSHWDREWYMPFEYHRSYLVKLIDDCMELFERDADFKSFHLDGYTALIEDYLEIKPKNKEKIKKYAKEGKFRIGPWYVLQDEFFTSSEANIRNLLVGISMGKEYGNLTMIGYFPDTFGSVGQMPQIMKQAGMKTNVLGRGVKPTGMNNEISEGFASHFSEFYWQAPDGSKLPSILLANWYNNAMEIPENADSEYWNKAISDAEKYASTDELLLMNGCDHQPVQKNLSKALSAAREKFPKYNFIHSDLERYTDALYRKLPQNLETIRGELIGQDTDGWYALVGTASSHMDLKVMNRKNEILLENIAEPLSVMAMESGKNYPHEMLLYSWKTLMKNHPHDSICGCSCDEVADEMRTRFIKSTQAAETVVNDALHYIAKHIDISGFEDCNAVFAVINTFSKKKNACVCAEADIRRIYGSNNIQRGSVEIEKSIYDGEYSLIDGKGRTIPCKIVNRRRRFGYDLPEQQFRQPYMAETVTVCFEAEDVPAMGYAVYGIKKENASEAGTLVREPNTMENKYLRVEINNDGTINLTDKRTCRRFENLLRFEDMGDVGNEYTFVPAKNDKPILSGNIPAEIELVKDYGFLAEYKISITMKIPESADETADTERLRLVESKYRTGGRSGTFTDMKIDCYVSLEKNGKRVNVRTEFENKAKDHRLRVLLPSGLKCEKHKAESVFEAVERNNRHKPTFVYPSGCNRQQGFVMINDGMAGLAVANIGLYEYEILNDNTIAVTLVRAVAEMGDWGAFPTTLSQQQKTLSLDYSVIPFSNEEEAYTECKSFAVPCVSVQLFESDNSLKNGHFDWTGEYLINTAFKAAQSSDDIIMRWVNYSDKEQLLTVKKTEWINNLYLSNVIEEYKKEIPECGEKWKIKVNPFEIITLGCKSKV